MAPPPARPRDKGGGTWLDVAAKEYANSNSTSAKFLGGLQKSWMTRQMENIRQPATASSRLITRQQNPELLQERLANQHALDTTASYQFGAALNANRTTLDNQSPPDPDSLPSRGMGHSLPNDPACAGVNMEAVLPSPAPSDEHRPDNFQPFESEIEGQAPSVQGCQTRKPPTRNVAYRTGEIEGWSNRPQHPVSAMTPPFSSAMLPHNPYAPAERPSPAAAVSMITNRSLQKKRKRNTPRSIAINPDNVPLDVPPSSSRTISPPTSSHNRHTPSDTQVPSSLKAVVARQQWVVEHNRAGRRTELARLNLLRSACAQDDHLYLLLHQIYCMYPRFVDSFHRLKNAGFHSEHFRGLSMLSSLLLPNSQELASDATDWFAVFPFPFEKLLHDFPIYRDVLKQVKSCLAKFGHGWPPFQDHCTNRRYPPFVDELVAVLGVESPTLQSVMFRAIHKSVWIGAMDDQCFEEGEKLFYENQQMLRQRSTPRSDAEKRTDNQNLIINYQRIQTTHMGHLQGNNLNETPTSSVQQTPMSPPSGYSQGISHGTQYAVDTEALSNWGRNPLPPKIDTQFAPHLSARTTSRTPPAVPSQPFLQGRDHPPTLQDSPRTFSASPNATFPTTGPRVSQARTLPNSGSPSTIPPHNYSPSLSRTRTWNSKFPIGPWPSQSVNPDYSSATHPVQTNRAPLHPQAVPSNAVNSAEHLTASNRFAPQQVPIANLLPQTIYRQPLLPMSGQNLSTTAQPNPMVTALHQYHATSPVLTAMDGSDLEKNDTKYFRYIKGVSVIGDRLKIGFRHHIEWSFDVDEAELGLLSGATEGQNGSLPRRTVHADSAFYRRLGSGTPNLPPNVAILLNDRPLDIRKKIHYGKDLPVDITASVQKGINNLSMSIIRAQKEDKTEYAMGIESVRLLDTEGAKALTQVLPYEDARQRILQRFRNSDPDIEVADASITLNLTDPYTSRIWDVPIRGQTCLHDQCFDLDMFLQTRSSKRPGQPSDPDQFKCPICDADARPQSLIKDVFFVALREMLAKQDRLDAKAIIMQQDGSWQIKEEKKTGETGDGSGRLSKGKKDGAANATTERSRPPRGIETIEIDND